MRCPCRKKSEAISYADCCGPYHTGDRLPVNAEALMRSRYAAFAMSDAAYLTSTWHPSTCPADIEFMPDQEWLQLKVLDATESGDTATVDFIARSRIAGKNHVLHEVSRFERVGGRWCYVDGVMK